MKRCVFILLIALSVLLLTGTNLFAAGGDMGGAGRDGSADRPYLIEDFNDFQEFCGDPNYWASGVNTRLECDLDLDPNLAGREIYDAAVIASGVPDADWQFAGISFRGVFDGNSHTISNLNIDGLGFCGLFGCIGQGGLVGNLGLENISVACRYKYAGGLAGVSDGSVTSCYSTGGISVGGGVSEIIGGLVGENSGSITSCYSTCSIDSSEDQTREIGGLVGENSGSIMGCYSTGVVNGAYNLGGLVGHNEGSVTNSYSTGMVDGLLDVGGLVVCNGTGSITNSYSRCVVTGNEFVGGLAGYSGSGSLTNCYSAGTVTGDDFMGGLVGYGGHRGSMINCFWNTETSGMAVGYVLSSEFTGIIINVVGKTTAEMQTEATFTEGDWDFVDESGNGTSEIWQMPTGGGYPVLSVFNGYVPVVLAGEGSKSNPYLISNAAEMGAMCHYRSDGCYELIADIDLNDIQWSTAVVPMFGGSFDGNDHVIYNLNIEGCGHLGLFGEAMSSAEIRDIGLESVSVVGVHDYVGGLVGENYGIVISSYLTGSVTGSGDYIGGLVGGNFGSVTSSYSKGAVDIAGDYVGGLVGYNYRSVTNSYSTCSVTGGDCVGGLVGANHTGGVASSYSTGEVAGGLSEGGLVGQNFKGSITNSFWDVESSKVAVGYYDYLGVIVNVVGKTTSEMQAESTFVSAGWDFDGEDVWDICDGMNYPKFSWQIPGAGDFVCGDGVDFVDFAVLVDAWGLSAGEAGYDAKFDLAEDGLIGFDDLAVFAGHWLEGVE